MITADEHLQTISREIDRIRAEATSLACGLDENRLHWKPAPGVWSAADCLEHLTTTAAAYFPYFEEALTKAGRKRPGEKSAYRPSWVGKWMIDSLGPEVRRKMKAPKIFRPALQPPPGALERFLDSHRKVMEFVQQARGLDINVRLRSPVTPFIRYSLGDAFQLIVVHAWRHLSQARRVLEYSAFPFGSGKGAN